MVSKRLSEAADAITRVDSAATEELVDYRDSLPVQALSKVAKLGDQPQMRALSLSMVALGLLMGNKRVSRAGIRMLAAHEFATAAKDFVKRRIDRTRPRSASQRRQSKARLGKSTAKRETSFPSGHSAGSMAVARAFGREFPDHQAMAVTAAGIVSVAQVPKQAHYPTDVAAGVAIGLASEAFLGMLWPGDRDDNVDSGDEPPPLA